MDGKGKWLLMLDVKFVICWNNEQLEFRLVTGVGMLFYLTNTSDFEVVFL